MMTEARPTFDDGAAYDAFMGRWSRAVGPVFLDWLAAPKKAAWRCPWNLVPGATFLWRVKRASPFTRGEIP
jgi:hypothetical protein